VLGGLGGRDSASTMKPTAGGEHQDPAWP